MEALHSLSDAIFNVKDKLTDAEFKELSDITKDLYRSVKHKAPARHQAPALDDDEVTPANMRTPTCPVCRHGCHSQRIRLNGSSQQHMTCGNSDHPIIRWLSHATQGDWFSVRWSRSAGCWVPV
jgi:hypothetical protein